MNLQALSKEVARQMNAEYSSAFIKSKLLLIERYLVEIDKKVTNLERLVSKRENGETPEVTEANARPQATRAKRQ